MRNIEIPETVDEYQANLTQRVLPEPKITENDFYRRLIGWVIDNRTPLIYEQGHPDEYTNLSINFNWLLQRDYSETTLGPPETILAMYALHEFVHMTNWLPSRLDEITAQEYAEQFALSEVRASNESEVLLHYRVPELREIIFQGMKITFDLLREKGIEQPRMTTLCHLRPVVVSDTILDSFFGDKPDDLALLQRLKKYNRNRSWAKERYEVIKPYFSDPSLPQGYGITDFDYESVIGNYEPHLSQAQYEANVIRNVRFAFAMCGLGVPLITSFEQAHEKAKELEGRHAIVQS